MESFDTKNCNDVEVSGPNSESSGAKGAKVELSEDSLVGDSVPKFESFGREECSDLIVSDERSSNMDGRSKPRTQKQIQSYRYNFSKRDSLAKKIEELDSILTFVQKIVLSMRS